jgi:hypothetical protein
MIVLCQRCSVPSIAPKTAVFGDKHVKRCGVRGHVGRTEVAANLAAKTGQGNTMMCMQGSLFTLHNVGLVGSGFADVD